jgi:hypothetical protein
MRLTSRRRRSAVLIIAALSVFLIGTNYCVLAAMSGAIPGVRPLVCHVDDRASQPAEHACCHAAATPARDSKHEGSHGSMPCCIQIAPPTSGAKMLAPPALIIAAVTDLIASAPAPTPTLRPDEPRSDPPLASLDAPLHLRAPPLS